jgi:hypothetical protein
MSAGLVTGVALLGALPGSVVAHLKNWRVLAYGYRRLISNFPATLEAVTKLEIFRTSTFASLGPR